MKKQLTALILTAALSVSSIAASASSFYDLNEFHAWAETQIEEMTSLGIIKGYTDGSFRPDRAITKTESLVLVARAAGYNSEGYDEFLALASSRYEEALSSYSIPYKNEVAFLLYKGILTEDDLSALIASDRADSPLLRYEMAMLLTKLMRAEENISSDSSQTEYSDAGDIPFVAAKYVSYVTNTSLMQGIYDPEYPDEVFFKPYSSVTRAQIAVLLHRVLSKSEVDVSYGTVVGKNNSKSTITYRNGEGTTSFFTLDDSVSLIIDGYKTKDLSHIASGAKVAFFKVNSTVLDVEIANDSSHKFNGVENSENVSAPTDPVEGKIETIIFSDDCRIIVDGGEYTLSSSASVYVDHVASTMYDLRVGYNAEITFEKGKAVLVYAKSPLQTDDGRVTAEGTITKLNVTNRQVYLEVENSVTGETNERALYIETGAAIFNAISGQSLDFVSLEIDDRISATGIVKDGKFYASKIIVR